MQGQMSEVGFLQLPSCLKYIWGMQSSNKKDYTWCSRLPVKLYLFDTDFPLFPALFFERFCIHCAFKLVHQ